MSVISQLLDRIRGFFAPRAGEDTRRPDGGTSCYRPVRRKLRDETEAGQPQGAEAPSADPSIPYIHTGFTDMNPPAGGNYTGMMNDPYGYGAAQAAQAARQAPAGGEANISYMPGVYAPDAGSSYTLIEHIMAITSLKSCYEAIGCMKNGETLIVVLDAIANESESIRCQDMLCGAAFTLGCTVRMLQGGKVVLIAPPGVKVLPEEQRPAWTEPAAGPAGNWNAAPGWGAQEVGYPPRRERRTSANAVGWEYASQEANQAWNPYTGTMPAAAGDYGSFGGYGV